MARIIIGLDPVQVAPMNANRHSISAQLIPSSIIAGNTGLVFGKFGSAPQANIDGNSWDFVLNAGAADGANLYETTDKSYDLQELWLVSDTAGQIVNVTERSVQVKPLATP